MKTGDGEVPAPRWQVVVIPISGSVVRWRNAAKLKEFASNDASLPLSGNAHDISQSFPEKLLAVTSFLPPLRSFKDDFPNHFPIVGNPDIDGFAFSLFTSSHTADTAKSPGSL
ncbi:hypothetical protein [Rhizobium acidisoli]|uniref:hypothetical protein n=1 Tax=Rhizobium acidisoli TaxID=1538158 RepID=UPI0013E8B0FD|nr:hypothetical protein [Rhizobium acidisoli]